MSTRSETLKTATKEDLATALGIAAVLGGFLILITGFALGDPAWSAAGVVIAVIGAAPIARRLTRPKND